MAVTQATFHILLTPLRHCPTPDSVSEMAIYREPMACYMISCKLSHIFIIECTCLYTFTPRAVILQPNQSWLYFHFYFQQDAEYHKEKREKGDSHDHETYSNNTSPTFVPVGHCLHFTQTMTLCQKVHHRGKHPIIINTEKSPFSCL